MSSGNLGVSWANKRILSDTNIAGPSLRALNGRLYLVWAGGDQNHSINTLESTNGLNWGHKHTYGHTSDYTPELVAAYGRLAVVWTGGDRQYHVNVMTLS